MLHKEMLLCGGGKQIYTLTVAKSGSTMLPSYGFRDGKGSISPSVINGATITNLYNFASSTNILWFHTSPRLSASSIVITRVDNGKSATCTLQSNTTLDWRASATLFTSSDVGKTVQVTIELK